MLTETQLRGLLGMMGLSGEKVFQECGTLSGGEKTKLALAMLMIGRNNLLLLDEPTNNLDPPSRQSVADALAIVEGLDHLRQPRHRVRRAAGADQGAADARRPGRLLQRRLAGPGRPRLTTAGAGIGASTVRAMRLGMGSGAINDGTIDQVVAEARRAADGGFDTYWVSQIFGHDALTVLAIVGREVPGIELGTAVVPTYPRHPMMLAQQALTVQAASGGRLCLGIGLSHQVVVESMWGMSFAKPVRHLREYLSVLMPLLGGQAGAFEGEDYRVHAGVNVAGRRRRSCSSPRSARRCCASPARWPTARRRGASGRRRCTTSPCRRSARRRPTPAAPRRGSSPRFPVCVTDDVDAARTRAAQVFAVYDMLPSYKAMMDREGVGGPTTWRSSAPRPRCATSSPRSPPSASPTSDAGDVPGQPRRGGSDDRCAAVPAGYVYARERDRATVGFTVDRTASPPSRSTTPRSTCSTPPCTRRGRAVARARRRRRRPRRRAPLGEPRLLHRPLRRRR